MQTSIQRKELSTYIFLSANGDFTAKSTQRQRGTEHYGERPGHQEDVAITDVYAPSHSVE